MPRRTEEETSAAGAEAFRGALVGAAKWGLIAGGLGFVGYFLSPIYRGLTIQFKVYVTLPCNATLDFKSTRPTLTPICTQIHPAIRYDIWGLD